MKRRHAHWALGIGCTAAIGFGWFLAGAVPVPRVRAGGADRWNDRVVLTGSIARERDRQGAFVPVEAMYILNYNNGLLLATVPSFEQSSAARQIFTDFAERDLVKDFGITAGTNPHFLMTTMSCGIAADGWEPLIVIETETGQVATYRVQRQAAPGTNRPVFLLIDRRVDRRLARSLAPATGNE